MKKDILSTIDKYLISSEPLSEDVIEMAQLMIEMSDDEYEYFLDSIDESRYPITEAGGALVRTGGTALAKGAAGKRTLHKGRVGAAVAGAAVGAAAAKKLYAKAKEARKGCSKKCASKSGDAKKDCMKKCGQAISKQTKSQVARARK